ncbi:MAG: helix-turn-helix domain-containing protein [Prevotellaceae bacterium]|jgi:hypothetical protein|nr:helix-turn-helix domain-containing protein [Prevotellaceae bacterium]
MFIDKNDFEAWMKRLWDRLESLENKLTDKKKERHTIGGELLLDNQDLCLMLNVSKRTLQRYRSLELLPFRRISQKTYYLESDVQKFIRDNLKKIKDND